MFNLGLTFSLIHKNCPTIFKKFTSHTNLQFIPQTRSWRYYYAFNNNLLLIRYTIDFLKILYKICLISNYLYQNMQRADGPGEKKIGEKIGNT